MTWVSVHERLPADGQQVLVWEADNSDWARENNAPPGTFELVTFKLTRHAWADDHCDPTSLRYAHRIEVADPTFHYAGGDCNCEWRTSDGFARSGGYSAETVTTHVVTHWCALPAPPP